MIKTTSVSEKTTSKKRKQRRGSADIPAIKIAEKLDSNKRKKTSNANGMVEAIGNAFAYHPAMYTQDPRYASYNNDLKTNPLSHFFNPPRSNNGGSPPQESNSGRYLILIK